MKVKDEDTNEATETRHNPGVPYRRDGQWFFNDAGHVVQGPFTGWVEAEAGALRIREVVKRKAH